MVTVRDWQVHVWSSPPLLPVFVSVSGSPGRRQAWHWYPRGLGLPSVLADILPIYVSTYTTHIILLTKQIQKHEISTEWPKQCTQLEKKREIVGIFPKCTWTKLTLMIQLWGVSLQSLNSDLLTTTAVNAIANLYYATRPMQTCLVSKRHLHTKSEVGEIAKTCKRSSSLLKSSNALVVKASISVAYALSREIGSQGTCLAHSVAFAMLYPSMLRCFI